MGLHVLSGNLYYIKSYLPFWAYAKMPAMLNFSYVAQNDGPIANNEKITGTDSRTSIICATFSSSRYVRNFIKGSIVLWNKTIINVIMLYIMTFHYINKIHFNRGQSRLPCILLLLGNEGCYVIQSK